jgi:hypothetical protein
MKKGRKLFKKTGTKKGLVEKAVKPVKNPKFVAIKEGTVLQTANNLPQIDDINLTMEIYKSFSYEDKQKFIDSQDGQVFFRKIRYSPLFKSLPSTTGRLVDMLAGTYQGGYYAREGELEGAPADPVPQEPLSLFNDKPLNSQHVESQIMASVTEPEQGWITRTSLMRQFKCSAESIEAALKDAIEAGRIAKVVGGGEAHYAMV